jgi:hypothetical protein
MCGCARGKIGSSFSRRVRLSRVSVKLKTKAPGHCVVYWWRWFPYPNFRLASLQEKYGSRFVRRRTSRHKNKMS